MCGYSFIGPPWRVEEIAVAIIDRGCVRQRSGEGLTTLKPTQGLVFALRRVFKHLHPIPHNLANR